MIFLDLFCIVKQRRKYGKNKKEKKERILIELEFTYNHRNTDKSTSTSSLRLYFYFDIIRSVDFFFASIFAALSFFHAPLHNTQSHEWKNSATIFVIHLGTFLHSCDIASSYPVHDDDIYYIFFFFLLLSTAIVTVCDDADNGNDNN